MKIFAFCLLPSEIQLILQPRCADQLAPFLQNVNDSYQLFVNAEGEPVERLRLSYYKNILINNDQDLFERIKHMECLPAGSFTAPTLAGYPWSSYAHHIESEPQLIDKTAFATTFYSRDYSPFPRKEGVLAAIRKWQKIFSEILI